MAENKKKKKGLYGPAASTANRSKKTNLMSIAKEAIDPALVGLGLIAGNIVSRLVDSFIPEDAAPDLTKIQFKKLVSPGVCVAAGVLGRVYMKDPMIKSFATGVGAYGIATGVGIVAKKDVLTKDWLNITKSTTDGFGNFGNPFLDIQNNKQIPFTPYTEIPAELPIV